MEPSNLNSSLDDEQRLKTLLAHAASPLPDDGFSARVLSALPAKTSSRPFASSTARSVACAVGAFAGVALVWNHGVSPEAIAFASDQLRNSFTGALTGLAVSAISIALFTAGCSLLYAFKPNPRRILRF